MTRLDRDPHPERVKGPYGRVIVGGVTYPNSWVPAGKVIIQVRCRVCEDRGVIMDDNDEPLEWCECTTGEACEQSGNAGGVCP